MHSNYFSKSPKYRNQDNYIIDLLQEFREDDFLLDDELISKFIDHCNDKRNIDIHKEECKSLEMFTYKNESFQYDSFAFIIL